MSSELARFHAMPESELDTFFMQGCIDRYRAGERAAMDDLLRAAGARLEKLSKRMTRTFPNVRDQADSGDVLQGSLVRLLRTLQTLRPATTRDFFNLAAVHFRRELLDLARRCKKRCNDVALALQEDSGTGACAPPAVAADAGPDFDTWVRFHEAVDALPTEKREVGGAGVLPRLDAGQNRGTVRRGRAHHPPPLGHRVRPAAPTHGRPAGRVKASTARRVHFSTRKSPARFVRPTRSRYSHTGTAYLRVVPNRSRISATVAPVPLRKRSVTRRRISASASALR